MDWAWLPRDLLDLILDRMVEWSDFIRFSYVCKPWSSIAHGWRHRPHDLLPMLLTSTKDNSVYDRSLYSITDGAIYRIQMPLACTRRFSGSSRGWVFVVDKSMNITLINLFLNKTVVLPKFEVDDNEYRSLIKRDDHDYSIKKAILLSQNQGGENFEVLLIYGGTRRLAYLNSRDGPWKTITVKTRKRVNVFLDVTCYKGQVYGVNSGGALVRVDVTTGAWEIIIGASKVFRAVTYLVESRDGDLLLVKRFLEWLDDDDRLHMTRKFEVCKLSWEEQGKGACWVGIESIGEQALFLGDNYSIAVSTREFPQCKPNCVYYVDHHIDVINEYTPRVNEDSGVYNMEDKSFTRNFISDPSYCPSHPSIWIVPNLNPNCF